MGEEARHPVLVRLGRALTAIGADEAVRRLEQLTPLLQIPDDEQLRSLVLRHCRDYGLDPAWILTGQGFQPLPAITVSGLTPVYAMTSVHPRTGHWLAQEIARVALVPAMLTPSRFVTRMDSRVMEPRIHLGAYLVVDTAEDCVPAKPATGQIFAVDVHGEGLVVGLVRYDRTADRLELTGPESGEAPFFVPCSDYDTQVIGRVVWVAQML